MPGSYRPRGAFPEGTGPDPEPRIRHLFLPPLTGPSFFHRENTWENLTILHPKSKKVKCSSSDLTYSKIYFLARLATIVHSERLLSSFCGLKTESQLLLLDGLELGLELLDPPASTL
ncbi:hypothetical protein NN561_018421 [Cricetulus griseus]